MQSLSEVLARLVEELSKDQIVLNGTDEYLKLDKSYFFLLQSDFEPAAILLPRSTSDVVKIVKLLKPHLLNGDIQLVIRGAGQ
jgi:FAD/FMN-containing dehydrogenase